MDFHTHYKPKVYTASKLQHAPMWRALRSEWGEHVEFTARWPDLEDKLSDSAEHARYFWMHDIQDVARADCVLVYSETFDRLRGALVEAGAGIALGKHVIVVGNNKDYGTWQFHPMVTRVDSLDEAILAIIGKWRSILKSEELEEVSFHIVSLSKVDGRGIVTAKWSDEYENSIDLRNYPSEDEETIKGRLQNLRVKGHP